MLFLGVQKPWTQSPFLPCAWPSVLCWEASVLPSFVRPWMLFQLRLLPLPRSRVGLLALPGSLQTACRYYKPALPSPALHPTSGMLWRLDLLFLCSLADRASHSLIQ